MSVLTSKMARTQFLGFALAEVRALQQSCVTKEVNREDTETEQSTGSDNGCQHSQESLIPGEKQKALQWKGVVDFGKQVHNANWECEINGGITVYFKGPLLSSLLSH